MQKIRAALLTPILELLRLVPTDSSELIPCAITKYLFFQCGMIPKTPLEDCLRSAVSDQGKCHSTQNQCLYKLQTDNQMKYIRKLRLKKRYHE